MKPDPALERCPRWERRPEDRRREIIEAGVLAFGQRGFECATLVEVGKRAGVCAGTVVHYFGSKAGLFEAVLADRFLGELADDEALVAGHRGSHRDLLVELLSRMWGLLTRPGTLDLVLVTLASAQAFPDSVRLMFRELADRRRRLLTAVLQAGVRSGEFELTDPELTARVLAGSLFGLLLGYHRFAQFDLVPPSPEQLLVKFTELADRALRGGGAPLEVLR